MAKTVPMSLSGACPTRPLLSSGVTATVAPAVGPALRAGSISRRVCFRCRGHKRKLNEEDAASESSGASSCEDEEGGSSEADEMAAALEAELGDLM